MSEAKEHCCPRGGPALHALADGELDAVHAAELELHLEECAACTSEVGRIRMARDILRSEGVRWRAPEHVRAQIRDTFLREARSRRGVASDTWGARLYELAGRWGLIPSAVALATALLLTSLPRSGDTIERDLVANHVRSLLADHLTDMATSDQHTVKPWFAGKIDFSPPVVDLSAKGFRLVGGRVDYLAGRVVAALVYRRNGHIINLFVWPDGAQTRDLSARDGYVLVGWGGAGLRFVAVSDVAETELATFRDAFTNVVFGNSGCGP